MEGKVVNRTLQILLCECVQMVANCISNPIRSKWKLFGGLFDEETQSSFKYYLIILPILNSTSKFARETIQQMKRIKV